MQSSKIELPVRSQEWFIENVRKYQARLRASIRALGVRPEAVDDLAQDVFILAWQKMTDFGTGDFGAWLVQIARRLIANERRKEAGRRRILAGEFTDFMLRSLAEAKEPAEQLAQAEEIGTLQDCLERLPPKGRQMIQWRYFEQLSPGAIASRLDRPSNYVRQSLLRLRRLLLQCVERQSLRQNR